MQTLGLRLAKAFPNGYRSMKQTGKNRSITHETCTARRRTHAAGQDGRSSTKRNTAKELLGEKHRAHARPEYTNATQMQPQPTQINRLGDRVRCCRRASHVNFQLCVLKFTTSCSPFPGKESRTEKLPPSFLVHGFFSHPVSVVPVHKTEIQGPTA